MLDITVDLLKSHLTDVIFLTITLLFRQILLI